MKWDIDLSVAKIKAGITFQEDHLDGISDDPEKLEELHDYLEPAIKQFGNLFMLVITSGVVGDRALEIFMDKMAEAHHEIGALIGIGPKKDKSEPSN